MPEALQQFSKYDGHWVAAPVNLHSTNWVWANKPLLDALGIAQPTTWDELVAAMQKVKDAGKIAVAHGGQPWQDATIFDAVAMSTGGPDFYKKAFIDLDPDTLGSDTMKQVFERMTVIRGFVDDNFSGRDWNLASAMVINGDAAFQFMGDWAKGEFLNAGKVPDKDFLCFRFPGTEEEVTFNTDQFAVFKQGERRDPGADGACRGDPVAGVPALLQQGQGLGAGADRPLGGRLRRLRAEGLRGDEGGGGVRQPHSARSRTATPTRRRSRTRSTT